MVLTKRHIWVFNIPALFIFTGLLVMNTQVQQKDNLVLETTEQDWHPADIIAGLRKAGWTLESLGRHHGLKSGATLSKALRSSFPLAESRIAEALGVHPKVIWPSRYHKNGERKLQGFHALQCKRKTTRVNGKDDQENSHESA